MSFINSPTPRWIDFIAENWTFKYCPPRQIILPRLCWSHAHIQISSLNSEMGKLMQDLKKNMMLRYYFILLFIYIILYLLLFFWSEFFLIALIIINI